MVFIEMNSTQGAKSFLKLWNMRNSSTGRIKKKIESSHFHYFFLLMLSPGRYEYSTAHIKWPCGDFPRILWEISPKVSENFFKVVISVEIYNRMHTKNFTARIKPGFEVYGMISIEKFALGRFPVKVGFTFPVFLRAIKYEQYCTLLSPLPKLHLL